MAKKRLSAEKAANIISEMIDEGKAGTPEEAVQQRPELEKGLKYFETVGASAGTETSAPVSRGSGPAITELHW